MTIKPLIFLAIPLIVIILFFGVYSGSKDPTVILARANEQISSQGSFVADSELVMDFSIMDTVMRYLSNITTIKRGDEIYIKVITQTPFSEALFVNEEFILDEGNYSCTNSLLRPVCFVAAQIEASVDESITEDDYETLEYLGSKSVNGVVCDAIFGDVDISKAAEVIGAQIEDNISKVDSMFLYSCIDPTTGITLESIWGIAGKSNFGSLIIDIGVNITKQVKSVSYDVPTALFVLPYDVISQEEYDLLVNETNEAISAEYE